MTADQVTSMWEKYKSLWITVSIICTLSCASGQEVRYTGLALGVRGGAMITQTLSTIPVLLGSTDCGVFSDGRHLGYWTGLEVQQSLFDETLEGLLGVTYSQRPAHLSTSGTDNFTVLDPRTNTYVHLDRLHSFRADLGYLAIQAGLRWKPFHSVPVYLRITGDAGNPIVNATYTQTERIVSPEGVLYPDNTAERTTGSGEFPGLSTAYGVSGGLGFAVDLSQRVQLAPEVIVRYGLNSITSTADWRQHWLAAGLHLRYRFTEEVSVAPPPLPEPELEPEPEPVVADTILPPPPATIVAVHTSPLRIQETVVTQTFPLLPYIFFDSAQAVLPDKYRHAAAPSTMNEAALPKETLPIYYRVLDIIGSRLARSTATLIVTGTTDGAEGSSSERRDLALRRAHAVAGYIGQRWNIPPSRFSIRTAEKPSLPSNEKYADGLVENRRVELDATDVSVLQPVIHSRFNEYVAIQPHQDFTVRIEHPETVTGWQLSVYHGTALVAQHHAQGVPPATVRFDLDNEITNKLGPIVGSSDTLSATLAVTTTTNTVQASTTFPVEKVTNNVEVSRLSLIVFDFDRSDIADANKQMMQQMITAAVRQGSVARIVGSTDRLGEVDHNLQLSKERALSVERATRAISPVLKIETVEGIGPSVLPYDNSLPEGRFYCRTVSLTITTPLR